MSIQKYPCGDCPDCTHIGEGQGLCDYKDRASRKKLKVVDLFDVDPDCPKPREDKNE